MEAPDRSGPVFLHELPHPCIVVFWRINRLQNRPVAVDEHFGAHLRNEVDREIGIVAGGCPDDSAFILQPTMELGALRSVQQTYHGRNDAAFLDECDKAFEDRFRILVESDNEPCLDLETRVLDIPDV